MMRYFNTEQPGALNNVKYTSDVSSLPLVSVIIPCYNQASYLKDAVDSIVGQSYSRWECIIINDGSTDATREVALALCARDPRLRYVEQCNKGLSGARNCGLREAQGAYIQFLDADDQIESEKFQRQVEYLAQHPEVDIVYGNVRYFHTTNLHERRRSLQHLGGMTGVSEEGVELQKMLARANIMVVNAPLVRRSLVDVVGFFDETLGGVADWDYWLRGSLHGKQFHYDDWPETLALVRYHSDSMSADNWRMLADMYSMQRKLLPAPVDPAVREIRTLAVAYASYKLMDIGMAEVNSGSRVRGMRYLIELGKITGKPKFFVYAATAAILPRSIFRRMAWLSEAIVLRRIAQWRGRI